MYEVNRKEILKADRNKAFKKSLLRHNEYYNMQSIFDNLYKQSANNDTFKHLYNLIIKEENIMLAYRNIKRNHGSTTAGTNRHDIKYWENQPMEEFIEYIRNRMQYYTPMKVRRVNIPKDNGKTRPLGIPCIEDRIIQQCIKQVLEPICEAKFHPHSYGFRPNRSTQHAYAYLVKKVNVDKCYHIVNIDIKGFFDNVNHSKLLKQLWTLGIHDKKLISIISAMLKAEIEGEGIPEKGVPQGGILSPLLANVVLNELDWWISNQWETFESEHQYSVKCDKYRHLRGHSKLKDMYIVRYADDFKIICKNRSDAEKIYIGVQKWLMDRLKLEISPEKSKIVDIRKQSSEFLGFRLKSKEKEHKFVITSHMTEKAQIKAENEIREQVKHIQKHPNKLTVTILNKIIVGLQNYYAYATNVNSDFSEIEYNLSICLKGRLKNCKTRQGYKTEEYNKRYEHYGGKVINACKVTIYPISCIKMQIPQVFNQTICNYTEMGRETIHTKITSNLDYMLRYITDNPIPTYSVEMNDNRISKFIAQKGKCAITGKPLSENFEIHKIEESKSDRYENLILVNQRIYELIHTTNINEIIIFKIVTNMPKKAVNKLNYYRNKIGNEMIRND